MGPSEPFALRNTAATAANVPFPQSECKACLAQRAEPPYAEFCCPIRRVAHVGLARRDEDRNWLVELRGDRLQRRVEKCGQRGHVHNHGGVVAFEPVRKRILDAEGKRLWVRVDLHVRMSHCRWSLRK